MNKVDEYILNLDSWKKEAILIRNILKDSELQEGWKWNAPCYTFAGKNICILGIFKGFCAISFFQGVLLKKHANLLVFPGENSRIAKLLKFQSGEEINSFKEVILEFIEEAIQISQSGIGVKKPPIDRAGFPAELELVFSENNTFEKAFFNLTEGRQRGYLIAITSSSNAETRRKRIDKYYTRILEGKGIHDCVCGLSKKMPRCDGSHKFLEK